ncbi:hypothetical protein BDN70DRAFT_396313 [Pholiota conissans]|uniref:Uncharacterized protein n=1 Tax=Pholiota conissans TaxID=109636 RepID=A0A9P5YQ22_9AGAR|nr:hypothetical protein BDN70DRAFT_396313 [Pholiota conissans]
MNPYEKAGGDRDSDGKLESRGDRNRDLTRKQAPKRDRTRKKKEKKESRYGIKKKKERKNQSIRIFLPPYPRPNSMSKKTEHKTDMRIDPI